MDGEPKRNKQIFLEKTKYLTHEEFRFLFLSLCNCSPRQAMQFTPNLFSQFISQEQNNYLITEDIVHKLGGIEEVESLCEQLYDIILTADRMRKTLNIEPYVYQSEEDVL